MGKKRENIKLILRHHLTQAVHGNIGESIIFRRLHWEDKRVKIDGEFLSNIRFVEDIFLCTETPQELQ